MSAVGGADLAIAAFFVLALCALLLGPLRGDRERRRAESFARRAGLPAVTPDLIHRVTRRWRFVVTGTVLGIMASGPLELFLVPVFGGLALGAVVDAVSRPGPPAGTLRVAHVTSTRLRDYVPPWVLGVAVAAAATAPLLALLWVVAPRTDRDMPGIARLSGTEVGWLVLAAGAGLAASFGLARWVVGRPQPAGSPEELAVDDALRAQAVRDVLQLTAVVSFAVSWILSSGLTEPDITGFARQVGGTVPLVMLVGVVVVRVVLEHTGGPRRWRTRLVPAG